MGIVSSTLAPVAIRLAWICQMLLDPRYSSIEDKQEKIGQADVASTQKFTAKVQLQQQQQHQQEQQQEQLLEPVTLLPIAAPETIVVATAKLSNSPTSNRKSPDNNNSVHQENRNRRAAQLRFKTRPSSFDAAMIVRGKTTKNSVIVTSTPSPLRRQNMRMWDVTSSSGCSSDSGSNSDSDSETELRVSENVSNEEGSTKLGMSAEELEAFRLTVGRGHFSRSKKDRFLNHLRLEKRLNDLNNEYFGMACKNHRHSLERRHSGDLHRII